MKDLDNWIETGDQLAISIAIILELVCLVLKEFKGIIGRSAVLELLGKRVFDKIHASFVKVVSQGSIENALKVERGHCRGHEEVWTTKDDEGRILASKGANTGVLGTGFRGRKVSTALHFEMLPKRK
jgi:hypothetical protein